MYGVRADIDLSFLHGAELVQICIGLHQVQFHFDTGASVSVQGEWHLTDTAGDELDRSHDEVGRPPYQLHRLLGQAIIATNVAAPVSVALQFRNGDILRIVDSADNYESFEIQPGNIIV